MKMQNKSKAVGKMDVRFTVMETRLLDTIVALCTEKTPFESNAISEKYLPQLNVLKIWNNTKQQCHLAASLWDIYVKILESLPSDVEINLDSFLHALDVSLNTEVEDVNGIKVAESALTAAIFLANSVGFAFSSIAPKLNTLIMNAPLSNVSKQIQWKVLTQLNEALSLSSMLHQHFQKFANELIEFMKNDETIPDELFQLVSSIICSTASLINVPILVNLQRQVCLAALSANSKIGIFKLLNALLEHNHEGVALPIQVAQTVFWRDYGNQSQGIRDEIKRGRAICQIYVRPRKIPCCINQQEQKPNHLDEEDNDDDEDHSSNSEDSSIIELDDDINDVADQNQIENLHFKNSSTLVADEITTNKQKKIVDVQTQRYDNGSDDNSQGPTANDILEELVVD